MPTGTLLLTVSVVWAIMTCCEVHVLSVQKNASVADCRPWAVARPGEQGGPQSLGSGFLGTADSSGKVGRAAAVL